MSREDPTRDDPCPGCGGKLEVRQGMFGLPDLGFFSGLVCEPCGSLLDNPDDSFLLAAIGRRDLGPPNFDQQVVE